MLKMHTMPLHVCRPVPLQRCYGVRSPLRSSGVKVEPPATFIPAASPASSAAPKRRGGCRRPRDISPSASVTSSEPAATRKKSNNQSFQTSEGWCTSSVQEERRSEKGQIVKSLCGRSRISCLSACRTNDLLAIGASKGRVMLLNLSTGERMHVDHACDGNVQELKWSPDGQKLAISCFSGTVTVWDRERGSGTCMPGMSVAWTDSETVITYAEDGYEWLWGFVSTGDTEQLVPPEWNGIEPGGGLHILADTHDGAVLVYTPEPIIRVLSDPCGLYHSFYSCYDAREDFRHNCGGPVNLEEEVFWSWSPCASQIARGKTPGDIIVEDIEPHKSFVCDVDLAYSVLRVPKLRCVAWRPTGHMLALATVRNRIVLWDYGRDFGRDYGTNAVEHCMDFGATISSLGWSACGKLLLVASKGCLHIFDVDEWAQESMFLPIYSWTCRPWTCPPNY